MTTHSPTQVEQLLRKILETFDQQPVTSGRLMRELVENDRQLFHTAARSALRKISDNRAYRYLIALLAGNNLLSKCVCDPALPMSAALTLARIGIQVFPSLDTRLTEDLGELLCEDGKRREAEAMRTLNILGEISNGPRLLPWLTNVLRHPNPRIRSKVALLIGRRSENSRWVEQHKEDIDPRVRANAIEGLWESGDEGARHALWDASRDGHNRVAGNALLGLYRFADTRVIERILEMSAHSEGRFRATAAWVMGETADPRFLPMLGKMLADSDGVVRTRAFRALAKTRQYVSVLEHNGRLRVHLWKAHRLPRGERRLCVVCVSDDGALPALPGTRFMVSEGAQAITAYEVRRRSKPALTAIGFALPRVIEADTGILERTLQDVLAYKKPDQSWAIVRYSLERPDPGNTMDSPRFQTRSAAIGECLQKRGLRAEAANGLIGAARLLLRSAVLVQGERHLVVVGVPHSPPGPEQELDKIAETARYHSVSIHGLSVGGGGMPILRVLCEATGGKLLEAIDLDASQMVLWRVFWGLQYQDEIHYQVSPDMKEAAKVRVQVWSNVGMAEDCLPLA